MHVEHGDKVSIFDIIINDGELVDIRRRDKGNPLSSRDEKVAEEFINKYWRNIADKWVNFFVYKKRIRCTDIKKKL